MAEGAWGELRSTIHPMSSIAWSSFATGTNPGKHGIFDVTEQSPGTYDLRFASGASRRGKTFWRALSEAGRRVGVINVPMTYPPEEVNGYLVAGMDSPGVDSGFTYPAGLAAELMERLGAYHIERGPLGGRDLGEYAGLILETVDNRKRALDYLRRAYPTELTICVFVATDRVHHFYWKYMEADGGSPLGRVIYDVYRRLDGVVGEVMAGLDDDTVLMLLSDHGAGPLRKYVNLNAWLQAEGWQGLRAGQDGGGVSFRAARATWRLLKDYLPERQRQWVKSRFGGARDRLRTYLFLSRIDWARTQAYSTGYFGDVRLNVRGREPRGIVEPGAEYERLRDDIRERLLRLCDPDTGRPMAEQVWRREDIYHGPRLELASDLVVQWREYAYKSRINIGIEDDIPASQVIIEPGPSYPISSIHRLNGIFFAWGKDVRPGRLAGAQIIDLAPTIMHLVGEPVPRAMDGRVLTEALDPAWLAGHPVRYREAEEGEGEGEGPGYSPEEEALIEERLKSLGYIE